MTDIVAQAQRVAGLIAEISRATAEQTQGIAQVGGAVAHLDQATQQNAAMVEQSAAAAQALRHQAAQLGAAVRVFRLTGVDSAYEYTPLASASFAGHCTSTCPCNAAQRRCGANHQVTDSSDVMDLTRCI